MAHASSSNTGPFLEKRGYIQVPEQVNCSFVFSNWFIFEFFCVLITIFYLLLFVKGIHLNASLEAPDVMFSCFIDLMRKIISSMEIINIVTDMGSSLVVCNSDRCVCKKKQMSKRLKT